MEQPLPPPDEVATVRCILARSREVYTEAALRRRLLTDGHDVAVVDETFRQIAAETDLWLPLSVPLKAAFRFISSFSAASSRRCC
jgi:hypothetical protein